MGWASTFGGFGNILNYSHGNLEEMSVNQKTVADSVSNNPIMVLWVYSDRPKRRSIVLLSFVNKEHQIGCLKMTTVPTNEILSICEALCWTENLTCMLFCMALIKQALITALHPIGPHWKLIISALNFWEYWMQYFMFGKNCLCWFVTTWCTLHAKVFVRVSVSYLTAIPRVSRISGFLSDVLICYDYFGQ